jgi:hypothetical protein
MMFGRMLKRWADSSLRKENERLSVKLQEAEVKIRLLSLEVDGLTGVVARDHKRVEAETSVAAKTIAQGEPSEVR